MPRLGGGVGDGDPGWPAGQRVSLTRPCFSERCYFCFDEFKLL